MSIEDRLFVAIRSTRSEAMVGDHQLDFVALQKHDVNIRFISGGVLELMGGRRAKGVWPVRDQCGNEIF